jgi:hypothetical protein
LFWLPSGNYRDASFIAPDRLFPQDYIAVLY